MNDILLTKKTWERFVKEGVLETSRISKRIVESWYRSKELNVNPYLEKGKNILTFQEYEKKLADNRNLLEIAMPYLEKMWRSARDKGVFIILTDSEGYILKIMSEKATKEFLNKFNIVEGVKWTENEVGTNAVGTTIVTQEAMQIVGEEHFAVASHNLTCSAAPIKNTRGELIGILDISHTNPIKDIHILSLVVSNAYSIESMWRLQEQTRHIALIEQFLKQDKNSEEKILLTDRDGYFVIASDSIMEIIKKDSGYYNSHIDKLKDMGLVLKKRKPIYAMEGGLLGYRYEVEYHNNSLQDYFSFCSTFHFLGEHGISIEFHKVMNEMDIASKSDITVSIYGESGTGKEVAAQSIHQNSNRKNKPFVAVNCGAIPKHLLESELFGYVEGAFTGALKKGYEGKFVQANGGTIFLDEIGEMPFSMQVALLRVIQEKEVMPIGGKKTIPIDVRIITATNKNLEELVRQGGKFREDLYYRLHVFDIRLPPLRERKKDIPYLIKFFFKKRNLEMEIPSSIIDCLTEYEWPGNIRELFNVLEKMCVLANGNSLLVTHVPSHIRENQKNNRHTPIQTAHLQNGHFSNKDSRQKAQMIQALQETNGDIREAANLIGMPQSTFYRKLKKFNL